VGEETAARVNYDFYRYSLGSRYLLVARDEALVPAFLAAMRLRPYVYYPTVDVEGVVRALDTPQSQYRISSIYARVDGYGSSLRSVGFFGQDLLDADFVGDLLPRIAPFRVSLRERQSRREALAIDNQGAVGFWYDGRASMGRAARAMDFLAGGSFIGWQTEK